MGSKIRVLSEQTINQIAAGEVVENPASVVKELVENAIDAGSKAIKIETRGGGQLLIRISDDGVGMNRDDAILCLERHATSKIRNVTDLNELCFMGFRGEALASIAAISKMTLMTAIEGEEGTCIEIDGGKMFKVEPYARTRGTTIDVRSLFYNVPARKKFQKSAAINTSEITRVVTSLALAHPEVSFQLVQQEREIFGVQGESIYERAEILLGKEFTGSIFKINVKNSPIQMEGFVGSPLNTRHHRSGQFLFINRRPVYCPLISLAVKDGYGTMLQTNRHPIYVLHLTIDQHLVDVNVHPQKKEVRLREETLFKDKIREAINLALQQKEEAPVVKFTFPPSAYTFSDELFPLRFKDEKEISVPSLPIEEEMRIIGLFSKYLLIDADTLEPYRGLGGIVLVDLISAQSRLGFEMLINQSDFSFHRQSLLFPITLTLPKDRADVEEWIAEIEKLGIEMRKLSGGNFIVDAIPSFIQENEVVDMVSQIAGDLHVCVKTDRLKILAALASRFAKAHKKAFMLQEAITLVKQLLRTSTPHLCPQGKPTMVHLNHEAISQLFSKT